jgi:acyl dehydratase
VIGHYFEDIDTGLTVELGTYQFTRNSIIAFARKYDPQAFHLEDKAAEEGPFGKLAASGWHTAAAWMRCYVATNEAARQQKSAAGQALPAIGPSPGFSSLRWIAPVFPGDILSYRLIVTGKRELRTRPKWGLVESRNEGVNQAGRLVFSFEGKVLVERRQ